jgi:tetratricopeptide (TPR) repeat protein
MKRLSILLAILLWTVPAQALPKPKDNWIEMRTANFTLFSNAGARDTRTIATSLERLRAALAQLSPSLALNSPYPTWIYVFNNDSSFAPYRRTYNGKPLSLGGYFLSSPLGNYVAINGDPRGDQTGIIYHEYLHFVLYNNYTSLPLWFHEGMAEYYSSFEVGRDVMRIGLPIPEHVFWLRKNPLIPLTELFAMDRESPAYNEGSRRGAFYAQSWALTHYLLAGNPERRRQALEYLRLSSGGATPPEAFRQAFGVETSVLEQELKNYVKSYVFNYSQSPFDPGAEPAPEARPMAWADTLFRLGDLLAHLDEEHRPQAAEHFRAALAAQPDHGPATGGLGLLAELSGRTDEARGHYEKAARLAPDDFMIQFLRGRHLLEYGGAGGADPSRQARAALAKTVELRPDLGEAWARLGYTYATEDPLPPQAVQALENARRLLPSRMDIAFNLSLAYARTGQRAKAEALIERVLAREAEPQAVADAREALLDEDRRAAEELLGQQKLLEAIPLLEAVLAKTRDPGRKAATEVRLEEVRRALDYNRFVEQYNQAVNLANQGNTKGAIAILEPLIETVKDPNQAEQGRALLGRLKAPGKKP